MKEIPAELVKAAYALDAEMQRLGAHEWQLGPVASRNLVARLELENEQLKREAYAHANRAQIAERQLKQLEP